MGLIDAQAIDENQIIERAIDRSKTPRNLDIRQDVQEGFACGISFGNQNLREDEVEVGANKLNSHGKPL
jgi:hypothetical protein